MNKQDRRYYHISDSKLLRPLLGNVVVAIGIHWVFQCILEMDRTERLFKIIIDLILSLLFYLFLIHWLPPLAAIMLSWLGAHTLNFLFNGQAFVVLKHFGNIKHQVGEVEQYIQAIRKRLQAEPSLRWAAIYGSLSRGEMKETSDLDVRVIRFPGFINGLRACVFVLRERTRAHYLRFPLDILLLDSPDLLKRMRSDELPSVIYEAS